MRYYLGLLLAWTGQRDAAIAQFEKAVALGPNDRARQAARTQFLERGLAARWDQAVGQDEPVGLWRPSDR